MEIRQYGHLLPCPFPTRKTVSLFAFLLLHAGRTFSRDALAVTFWPDADRDAARASLRTAMVPIRRLLEPNPTDRGCSVRTTHTTLHVTLPPGTVVDVREFEHCLGEARRLRAGTAEWFRALETAVALYAGDLLPELDATWCLLPREALRQQLLTALHELARADQEGRQYARAKEWARRALEVDPCDEESHRRLMQLCATLGQHAGVVRQYHECRRVLEEELETVPEAETRALFQELQSRARMLRPPERQLVGSRQ
jgi:DNA-binding SARP family transcriptional activator